MPERDLLDDELDEQPTIKVNEQYARRFEHNKRREELHRLQEKHPEVAARLTNKAAAAAVGGAYDEEEDESSTDEDSEELDADDDTDKVLETLVRLKKNDPLLKQPDVVLFPKPADSEEGEEDGQQAAEGGKKSKPMYLRTVLAKQALEGAAGSDSDAEGDEAVPKQPVAHSYAAEQQELKKAFLQAAEDAEEGVVADAGGVLRKKAGKRSAADAGEEGQDKEQQVNKLLDEYFGKGEDLDPAGAFLKAYIANKAWKEADGSSGHKKKRLKGLDGESSSSSEDEGDSSCDGEGGSGDINVDEDEQFLEEVDRFEAAYNFRYEEPGSHRIQSFPRVIEDSVRRPDERRKRQRDAKAARKQAEKEEREAEIRRLKNLKKQEIHDMFGRIQVEAGVKSKKAGHGMDEDDTAALAKSGGLANLLDELLEGDFDPDAYDKRMAAAFDDSYYEGDDEHDDLFGDADEELAAEDDVLKPAAATALGDDEAAGGFAVLHQQLQQQQGSDSGDEGAEGGEQEEEGATEEEKAAAAAARAEQRSQLQRKLEEYYKLDCEDNIGGIPCRFKYRQVAPESFGLSVADILNLPDKELNQIIGMKMVAAPYRDDSKRLRPNYKALQRIKGEAAAAEAMRQHKRQKQKHKDVERQQRRQQEQQQQRQQEAVEQAARQQNGQQQQRPAKQQQQHAGNKRRFEQAHGHKPYGQQHRKQQQQQQKPLSEMTAEEKQAARLASYAKLTLKPSQQDRERGNAGGDGMQQMRKKHRAGGDEQQGQHKKKKEPQPQPAGRLAAVPVDKPLTKAQKKNLLRSLKRKEKKGAE